jgi:hypothetical protein
LAVSSFRFRARLDVSIPCLSLRPARHYPRLWIRRSSSERRRDFNPPDLGAAQRTSGRRRRARLLSRWPPSAAQTGRAVFPHPAFTKTSSLEERWQGSSNKGVRLANERVNLRRPRRIDPVNEFPRPVMSGSFTKGTVHLTDLTHLAFRLSSTVFVGCLPRHTLPPLAWSRGFHRTSGTTQPSDDSRNTASHFACAYRVTSLGVTRGSRESSWGHAQIFRTVPSANTLVRWVNEKRLRLHSAGSTLPHLWPTGSSLG